MLQFWLLAGMLQRQIEQASVLRGKEPKPSKPFPSAAAMCVPHACSRSSNCCAISESRETLDRSSPQRLPIR
jgi:hypothetical protein